MAAAVGDRDLVELGVPQHRSQGVLPPCRAPVDSHPLEIEFGKLLRRRPPPRNPVGEARVGQVAPADVVKRLRTIARSHSVDLPHHKAAGCQIARTIPRLKRLGHMAGVRPRVDLLNHRHPRARRNGSGGPVQDAMNGGLAIATGGHEPRWPADSRRREFPGIGLLEFADLLARVGPPEHMLARPIDARPAVDEEVPIG